MTLGPQVLRAKESEIRAPCDGRINAPTFILDSRPLVGPIA